MQRQIGNLKTAETYRSGNFVQKHFSRSARDGEHLSRLIYFTNLSSTALVHRLENRPIQSGNSCIPTNMEQPSRLLLPVILSYFSSFNKSRPESDRKEVACPTKEVLYLGSKTSLVTPI